MFTYTIRRLMFAVPTLLVISFIIFALLDLAPSDPTGNLPLTIPPEVREKIRLSLGLGEPFHIRYLKWMEQFFVNEPLNILEEWTGWTIGNSEERLRVLSWSTRSPVVDLIVERMPQTLWVVGMAYVVGILIALPVGVISAYKQYSIFDQSGTFVTMIGFSIPPFFSGVLVIVIFSVNLGWFPSIYDTTHEVVDWQSFKTQINQMLAKTPVEVTELGFPNGIGEPPPEVLEAKRKLYAVEEQKARDIKALAAALTVEDHRQAVQTKRTINDLENAKTAGIDFATYVFLKNMERFAEEGVPLGHIPISLDPPAKKR